MFYFCLFSHSVSSSPRAKKQLPLRGCTQLFSLSIKWGGSFRGAFLFFRPRAFIFSLFLRVVGGNLLRRIAPTWEQEQEQKTNRPKSTTLADSNTEIHFSLPGDKNGNTQSFSKQNTSVLYKNEVAYYLLVHVFV